MSDIDRLEEELNEGHEEFKRLWPEKWAAWVKWCQEQNEQTDQEDEECF